MTVLTIPDQPGPGGRTGQAASVWIKFDPDGGYVRTYVPEIRSLPPRFVHKPWAMPERERSKLGFELGDAYPEPLVDLKTSREEALEAFKALPKR